MIAEEFWNWFDENKSLLEDLISGANSDYEIYETLSDKLEKYSEFLIPELTKNEKNNFVLVISCDGNRNGIEFANSLTQNLRKFENWDIVKFRQPGPMEFIPLYNVNFSRSNIFLKWEKSSNKYYITFFVKNYFSSNPDYEISTLLHMDHTIGEYNSMAKIYGAE